MRLEFLLCSMGLGVIYDSYRLHVVMISCHQLCTVVLSFLPYTTGKQQLDEEMPQIQHFHFINRSQRDKYYWKTRVDIRSNSYLRLEFFLYNRAARREKRAYHVQCTKTH